MLWPSFLAEEPSERYAAATDYAYSYIFRAPGRVSPEASRARDLQYFVTLEDFSRFLTQLGSPERRIPLIHVAGTNGKGSTSAMICAVLSGMGLRVGLYTSPHLSDLRERIRIGNDTISDETFVSLMWRLRPIADRHYAPEQRCFRAFGQLVLALALLYFAESEVDVAVIETGYGGRWDNSNVITPALSVITSVSLDHKQLLGPSLSEIAEHKAGIIKTRVPVVLSPQEDTVSRVMCAAATAMQAPIHWSAEAFRVESLDQSLTGTTLRFADDTLARIPLAGPHQVENALTALHASELFLSLPRQRRPELFAGLPHTIWPGRCEVLNDRGEAVTEQDLAADSPIWLLDGAHNHDAALRLRDTLVQLRGDRPIWLLLAFGMAKQSQAMLDVLLPLAERVWVTRFISKGSQDPDALAELVSRRQPNVAIAYTATAALAVIRPLLGRELVVATGSLFLVGELRRAFARSTQAGL